MTTLLEMRWRTEWCHHGLCLHSTVLLHTASHYHHTPSASTSSHWLIPTQYEVHIEHKFKTIMEWWPKDMIRNVALQLFINKYKSCNLWVGLKLIPPWTTLIKWCWPQVYNNNCLHTKYRCVSTASLDSFILRRPGNVEGCGVCHNEASLSLPLV